MEHIELDFKKKELPINPLEYGSKWLVFTPLAYALLVFIGYLSLDSSYREIGVRIWPYLDITDLLLSFLLYTPFVIFLCGLMCALFIYTVLLPHGFFRGGYTKRIRERLNRGWYMTKLSLVMYRISTARRLLWFGLCVYLSLSSTIIFGIKIFEVNDLFHDWIEMLMLWISLPITLALGLLLFFKAWRTKYFIEILILVVASTYWGMNSMHRFNAKLIKSGHKMSTAVAYLDDDTTLGGNCIVYVGQTSRVFVFYDLVNEHPVVVPASRVERFDEDPRSAKNASYLFVP